MAAITYIHDFFGGQQSDVLMRAIIEETNEADTMVTFFDRRHPQTENGQTICGYYMSDLLESGPVGLDLMGGVPEWTIKEAAFAGVYAFMRQIDHTAKTEVAA